MPYKTKQMEAVLACLKAQGERHISAAEIEKRLKEAGESVGLTTVYRRLDRLVAEGTVKKFVTEGGGACYQYVGEKTHCSEHFHLKCDLCGRLIHLQCRTMESLSRHILEEHGFMSDPGRTTLYGICRECREAAEEKKCGD